MSSRLDRVGNWTLRAKQARYSGPLLAQSCGVSLRQLERYFAAKWGWSVNHWLRHERMRVAADELLPKKSTKEAAFLLHYKDPSHFCRHFKKEFGDSPMKYSSGLGGMGTVKKVSEPISDLNVAFIL